ncbi:MAG: hypothetical protein EXQ85_04180 [Alphaproteobacteria bacterium]|nr:hypothetical protein [Alphaproteobacteria bacterium]
MSAESDGRPKKLSLVVFSADFDKVHYALATASAALAVNIPATLFFTMGAIRALGAGTGPASPGWHGLATGDGRPAHLVDNEFGRRGVGQFEELLGACVELRATFLICDMGLRAIGLTLADLRRDISYSEGGLVTFLNDARHDGLALFF